MKRIDVGRRSRAASWARLSGGLSLPVLALAAIGTRLGFVPDPALLPALALGFALGIVGLALGAYALADIWNSGADGAQSAIAGIVYASPAIVLLTLVAAAAVIYPPVTDVSTNPTDPPAFLPPAAQTKLETRAASQEDAYPDVEARIYPLAMSEVYGAARQLIMERGWTVTRESHPLSAMESPRSSAASEESDEVTRALALKSVMTQSRTEALGGTARTAGSAPDPYAADPVTTEPTIQAVAPTPIFGFPDDVVLRLTSTPEGTRVDMRSASRIGEHDLGQNARRIQAFLDDLDSALQPSPDAPAGSFGGGDVLAGQ